MISLLRDIYGVLDSFVKLAFLLAVAFIAAIVLSAGLFLLVCAISSLFVNSKKLYDAESAYYRFLLNAATSAFFWLFRIKVSVEGIEKLPKDSRFLIVSNHRSKFDPIVSWYALKKYHLSFISKEENFKIPFFGKIIRRCCFLPIDREDARNAIETINKAALIIEKGKNAVGVYPEGTRNRGKYLLPFHNGVFLTAKKAHVPVVVMTIEDADKIHNYLPFHSSCVKLNIVEVIPYEEIAKKRTNDIGDRVLKIMSDTLNQPIETSEERGVVYV